MRDRALEDTRERQSTVPPKEVIGSNPLTRDAEVTMGRCGSED